MIAFGRPHPQLLLASLVISATATMLTGCGEKSQSPGDATTATAASSSPLAASTSPPSPPPPTSIAPVPQLSGRYNFAGLSGGRADNAVWVMTPCGAGCLDVTVGNGTTSRATLTAGEYAFDLLITNAARCGDGRVFDVLARYVFAEDGAGGSIAPADGINPCGSGPFPSETFVLTPA